jgi:hypothetical protein
MDIVFKRLNDVSTKKSAYCELEGALKGASPEHITWLGVHASSCISTLLADAGGDDTEMYVVRNVSSGVFALVFVFSRARGRVSV